MLYILTFPFTLFLLHAFAFQMNCCSICFQSHFHFIHHEFTAYLMQIILISIWTLNTEEYMDT